MAEVVSMNKDRKDGSKDKLFDPSIEMLIHDYDDEKTLEEEEALAANESEDVAVELSNLEKEGNMPLEELLALYGYRGENQENERPEEETEPAEAMEEQESENDQMENHSKLRELYEPFREPEQDASRLLRSVSRVSEEEEEDYDYSPDEEDGRKVNKTIMVGSDYQAQIPEGLSHYGDALPYENDDKLVWDPSTMKVNEIEDYLKKAHSILKPVIPIGTQLKDDEQALFLLQQCGHNVDEALRRLKMNALPNSESMSIWSEEECQGFEWGVQKFGKNFRKIQRVKVKTRSVGELVQFYYLWKKSERHDIFANKTRLEKKKYALHPGLTDFMDRFLEDQDGRDRSSSPNVQYNASDKKSAD